MKPRISRSVMIRSGLSFLLLLCLLRGSSGQEGAVRGLVRDPAGQPLKDVKVTFTDTGSGNRFSFKTNKEGKFLKFAMPQAEYRVQAELEGYKPFVTILFIVFGKEENVEIVIEKIPPKIDEDKDFVEGVNLFKQAKYKESAEFFEKAAARYPDSPEVLYNLGVSALRDGNVDRAIAVLDRALELKPDMVEASFALGEGYFNKGEKDKATEAFARAIDFQPTNAKAYYNMGVIYYKFDRLDEALAAFQKSMELEPDYSSAFYQAGLVSVKKGDLKGALQYFETFLKIEPDAPEASQVKIMIEELKKQLGESSPPFSAS
jgi:superkiller protein 3